MAGMDENNNNDTISLLLHDVSHRVARAFDKRMEPLGLTRSQWGALVFIAREPGIAQTKLAGQLDIGRMAVTGLIDRMESKSLVRRDDDPNDRRIKRLYLCDKAVALLPTLRKEGSTMEDTLFADISTDEKELLMKSLVTIKQAVERFEETLKT